jgi:hypothetical protein
MAKLQGLQKSKDGPLPNDDAADTVGCVHIVADNTVDAEEQTLAKFDESSRE